MKKQNTTEEPYSTHLKLLHEMHDWVGKEMGLSNWFTVSQEDINTFARITQDEQWIHVDVERSKRESPYGKTIAHGFLVLSYASRIAYDCLTCDELKMGVNYGLNKVRFINSVPSGARIRGRMSLLEFEEKPAGGKYILNMVFEMEGQEQPVCVAEFIALGFI